MFEELSSSLTLDASDFVSGADDASDAAEGVAGSTDSASDSLFDIDKAGLAAGGALVGFGTAAQEALDDTRDMRESLGRTATNLGITDDEANDLATSMSNATFPLEDVTASMDNLAAMTDTPEQMEETALAADNLADATGTSASEITQNLAPAVNGLDGNLDALIENQDAFTLAANESNLSIEDIGNTLQKLDFAQLEEMGLKSDEVAGLMSQFADETGYSGRQLESNFNQAVRDADGDIGALQEELGLGGDALQEWDEQVNESAGVTDEYASSANDSVSTMDRLRSGFEDVKLQAADMLGPMSAVAPIAQTMGITMMTLSTINTGAVIPSLLGVASAAAPVVIPLLALAAVAGALYVAWQNDFWGIHETAMDVAGGITDRIGRFASWISDTFWGIRDSITSAVTSLRDSTIGRISDLVSGILRLITGMDVRGAFRRVINSGYRFIRGRVSAFWRSGKDLVGAIVDGVLSAPGAVKDAVGDVVGSARDMLPFSDAKEGPMSDLTASGEAIPETLADSAAGKMDALKDVLGTVDPVTPPSGSGGGGSSTVNIELNIDARGADPREVERASERSLTKALKSQNIRR